MRTTWHFRSGSKDAISFGYLGIFCGASVFWGDGETMGAKFWDSEIHWGKRTESQLVRFALLPSIVVDHVRGLMARAIDHPSLGLAVG